MSIISVDQIGARVSGAAVTVSGGRFDVGSNVQLDGGTGIVSATSYKGDGSSLTGIAVTSDINTNNIKVSGISTLGHATGTELKITGITTLGTETTVVGSAVTFDASGGTIVGVLTATSFSGDGSALAGIAATDNINTNNIAISGIATVGTSITMREGAINVTGIVTAQAFVPTVGQLSHRNLMINGAMQVAQRGTSTSTNSSYACDRYRFTFYDTDEAPTMAQHALTSSDTGPWEAGFRYSTHITNGNQTSGAGAADTVFMKYKIEAQDLAQSGWEYNSTSSYVTLSFWVKASVAQNYYGYILTEDTTKQCFPFETGSLTADTWKKVTVKIPGNSNITINNDTDGGMSIHLAAFVGTDQTASGVALNTWAEFATGTRMPDNTSTWYTTNDSTFEFTGFQLEVGPVATPFEHLTYAEDLKRCERYCQVFGGDVNFSQFGVGVWKSSTAANCNLQLMTTMRAAPTMTVANPTDSTIRSGGSNRTTTTVVLDIASTKMIMYNANAASGGTDGHGAAHFGSGNTNCTLTLSSEL